ncbi:MbnP family protein [Dyadobacter fermentans]|uniref:Copper-binding protein MbnP-like domain-containing protein n=1 Tax=Dyadobacter fermentans (strain ATCC 700827 / DSM 18053 / CIP 107007 / KCTC 52180 / NS114) TaxID=471854 RepID=C6VVR2_DYAFD|nr:MbnP family protein [Dyadobacter fermentans]ACT91368.1 conserved hypothetical protein [Dyadobacter fermentans DSM 18053]
MNFSKVLPALLVAVAAVFMLVSCSDNAAEPAPPTGNNGALTIEFDNIVGDKNLVLNGAANTNAAGEDFVLTKFNYYVSNIRLLRQDGTSYTVPQDSSYFLIMEDKKESQFVRLKNVPPGTYTGLEFMLGVDSLRNTMSLDKWTGVLDPGGSMMEDGMYWAWESGFIFLKMEGTSSKASTANGKFYYHIGLYGGMTLRTVNNTRVVKLSFGDLKAEVTTTQTPEVHLFADVQKVFNGPGTNLSIAAFSSVMTQQQEKASQIANNYAKMFSVDHIH